MLQPRPGYEGVRSDTRRAPIPDLPIDLPDGRAGGGTDDRFATATILSCFGGLLAVGVLVWMAFAPAAQRVVSADRPIGPDAVFHQLPH